MHKSPSCMSTDGLKTTQLNNDYWAYRFHPCWRLIQFYKMCLAPGKGQVSNKNICSKQVQAPKLVTTLGTFSFQQEQVIKFSNASCSIQSWSPSQAIYQKSFPCHPDEPSIRNILTCTGLELICWCFDKNMPLQILSTSSNKGLILLWNNYDTDRLYKYALKVCKYFRLMPV